MARKATILSKYTKIAGDLCVYCGEAREAYDHVMPYSWAEAGIVTEIHSSAWALVPACTECNMIASGRLFTSFPEKYNFIKLRLTERYQPSINSIKKWTIEEINELGPGLRSSILSLLDESCRAISRINWEIPATILHCILNAGSH